MKQKRSEITARYIARIVFGLMCVVLMINILAPDKATSQAENRSLQTFPKFDSEDVLSGQFSQELNNYVSDQFVGRDSLIHIRYLFNKLTGVKKINDVYLGNGTLIQENSAINEEQMNRNINAINNFCINHQVRSGFLLAPNAANIQSDNLPAYSNTIDQDAQMDQIFSMLDTSITQIDVRDTLDKHKDEYLYYHTDHHWTSLATFYAFQQLASSFELGEVKKSDYTVYQVSDNFKGTLAKKVGSVGIQDDIEIYVSDNIKDYVMMDESNGTRTCSIYNSKGLESSNPYDVFLGGNTGLVQIENLNDSDRHLLLIKDSYANSMVQFLLPYYRTITIVDPRYFYEDIERIFNLNLITDVLFLYNTNTFVQDTSIADVLE